jgi:hypothetical protein
VRKTNLGLAFTLTFIPVYYVLSIYYQYSFSFTGEIGRSSALKIENISKSSITVLTADL